MILSTEYLYLVLYEYTLPMISFIIDMTLMIMRLMWLGSLGFDCGKSAPQTESRHRDFLEKLNCGALS